MRQLLFGTVICTTILLVSAWQLRANVAKETSAANQKIIASLEAFTLLVGDWRGVGQPKRGSQQGAWQENGACVWEISKTSTGLRWTSDQGKLWTSLLISYDEAEEQYTVSITAPDKSERHFLGSFEKQKLIADSPADANGEVQRVTVFLLNDNRLTVLLEKRAEKQTFYNRIAEVAFQRQGTKLDASDNNGPECVVTGGKGTIAVSYKGKTYYVCCTGCREAFNDDPEGILAAWEAKKKGKKSE